MATYLARLAPTRHVLCNVSNRTWNWHPCRRHRARHGLVSRKNNRRHAKARTTRSICFTPTVIISAARGQRFCAGCAKDADWLVIEPRRASASGATHYSNVIGAVIRQYRKAQSGEAEVDNPAPPEPPKQ